jgi:molybdenum cofactor synthesis domain-containing protein
MRTAAIVTASDGVGHGTREDASGDALAERLAAEGFEVVDRVVVPDERDAIAGALRRLADDTGVGVVVVTGGTGFGPRDVTPEATEDVVDRRAPGLAEAMRAAGRASTPMADLSRATAGLRGTTLVLNVPGSPRGATESLDAVLPLLPHALQLLDGDTARHPEGHGDAPHHAHDHTHDQAHGYEGDEACALAHGFGEVDRPWTLVTISASPVALMLMHWGRELGYRTVLVEEDAARVTPEHRRHADRVVTSVEDAAPGPDSDVVATDHDVVSLPEHLAAALRSEARWIGLMGSKRHTPPHIEALRERGFPDREIGRIERPIGLDLGSHTPAEIALATLAGLLADRNDREVRVTRRG